MKRSEIIAKLVDNYRFTGVGIEYRPNEREQFVMRALLGDIFKDQELVAELLIGEEDAPPRLQNNRDYTAPVRHRPRESHVPESERT